MKTFFGKKLVQVMPSWREFPAVVGEDRGMRAECEALKAEVERLRLQNDLLHAENDRLKADVAELYRRLIRSGPEEGDDETYVRLAQRLSRPA